jgi:20S proteasome subunit beta 7
VPVNIGTSVIGLHYADGIMLAADTAVAYGSMKKTKHVSRISQLGDETAFACSGEMSDF